MGESFTIQISTDLIRQLTSNNTKPKRSKKTKPKASQDQLPQPQGKTKPTSDAEKSSSPGKWPQQTPIFLPFPMSSPLPSSPTIAELEAIKSALQESEKVVEKLEKQETNMVQELTQRAKELREKEFKLPYQKPMPCLNERDDCLQCYKEHLQDPLKCASAVKKFADCARQARQQAG
ncbi:uncharacterized protein LOC110093947 [Dendrobium catenatum]|uniref:Uncharacterized protein n=1 Tax=Dendrobium catenatum TaxID=906689 RepID=A0A2I0VF90_9ASPA|nr:uncharacterized protein LOC110093947 [Dendrobium catenatum]XP_028547610.1 uncharacterized protein LOC110093947 [Dendrobium catenatum]XP_028547611.1 uncharacterized protein LOC110093947 [Dendrobium catenatum]XP_028547612.1 uncharacterized protein LOC110093947 [Dendrobium catenatum]XP_028547613.1 uncharacterized protein LOC110093947 [Dendrobium catenatum]PKU62082.1 hypothetical protein MA16_Dca025057 [Dendrobium catenatum]